MIAGLEEEGGSSMAQAQQILPFAAAEQRGGVMLNYVDEVQRACAISRLPSAPGVIEGIINLRGEIVPVVDLRARFDLPRKPMELNDRFIIVRCSGRRVGLHVDEVDTPRTLGSEDLAKSADAFSGALGLNGVAKLTDDLLLIYDADAFLSSTEKEALERALAERRA
jgi:purine-binding chemotaxis protein CheW